jgi:leucyl aminopeptidase
VRAARDAGAVELAIALPTGSWHSNAAAALRASALGAALALYRFDRYRGAGTPESIRNRDISSARFYISELGEEQAQQALAQAETIAGSVAVARDLGNEPASTLTPRVLAERAQSVAAAANLEIEILGPEELVSIGANAMLAVGGGSVNPPRLVRLRYSPRDPEDRSRVVGLVGKAITFDTGGYSIKPYDGMLEMKGDMAGGAAVLGVMAALDALRCPVAVEATICAAENMISGAAFRPGDVIEGMNGVTMGSFPPMPRAGSSLPTVWSIPPGAARRN